MQQEAIRFCEKKGIKEYDVQLELADHICSLLEEKGYNATEMQVAFKNETRFREFVSDWSMILNTKKREIARTVKQSYFKELRANFTLPRLILILLIFAGAIWTVKAGYSKETLPVLLHIFNIINLGVLIVSGNNILYRNRSERKLPLLSIAVLRKMEYLYCLPAALFLALVALGSIYAPEYFTPQRSDVIVLIYPIVVTVQLAWSFALIKMHKKIRKMYSEAFT